MRPSYFAQCSGIRWAIQCCVLHVKRHTLHFLKSPHQTGRVRDPHAGAMCCVCVWVRAASRRLDLGYTLDMRRDSWHGTACLDPCRLHTHTHTPLGHTHTAERWYTPPGKQRCWGGNGLPGCAVDFSLGGRACAGRASAGVCVRACVRAWAHKRYFLDAQAPVFVLHVHVYFCD